MEKLDVNAMPEEVKELQTKPKSIAVRSFQSACVLSEFYI